MVLDDIWLPGDLHFKGLTTERLNKHRGPFYGLFETEFGVHMVRAQEKVKAVAADEESGGAPAGGRRHAACSVERKAFIHLRRQAVELRRGFYQHFARTFTATT